MQNDPWSGFPDFDASHWEQQVGDLRHRVHVEEGWVKPIWATSTENHPLPERCIAPKSAGNPWQIIETVSRAESVMPALLGGVEGLRLSEKNANESWLEGVHLEMIGLHLDFADEPANQWDFQGLMQRGWRGSCLMTLEDMSQEACDQHHAQLKDFSNIKIWKLHVSQVKNRLDRMVSALHQLDRAVSLWEGLGYDVQIEVGRTHWAWELGPNVLEEIAMLRSGRFLWSQWLQSKGMDFVPIWIDGLTDSAMYQSEPTKEQLISMTTASYAGVIGGADSIETLPHDFFALNKSSEALRWARNIQHIMREESNLHCSFDPMGGSHLIENWTNEIVQKVWSTYQKS
ncbi:MAG: methylmalonyl-CoA mutase family protein [Flavobacteriales bacterium]